MKQQIKQLTESARTGKPNELHLPTQVIHKGEEYSGNRSDSEDSEIEEEQPVLLFDQILKIVQAMSINTLH